MWTEAKTRVVVKERSLGCCEKCGLRGREMHHRKNRSQGGKWTPSNIILLCMKCHNWVGSHPDNAHLVGLHLRPWESPEETPISTGLVPFLLDDDGGYTPCNDADVLELLPGVLR